MLCNLFWLHFYTSLLELDFYLQHHTVIFLIDISRDPYLIRPPDISDPFLLLKTIFWPWFSDKSQIYTTLCPLSIGISQICFLDDPRGCLSTRKPLLYLLMTATSFSVSVISTLLQTIESKRLLISLLDPLWAL